MQVEILNQVALNPSIIRVNAVTFTLDPEDGTRTDYRYFELALPIEDFIEDDGKGNVGINELQYQQVVTNKIMAASKPANIAAFLDTRNLTWDVIVEPVIEPPVETEDKIKLAFGSNNVSK